VAVKNRLTDLNDYLFEQLERLADENLSGEQIETEIKRSEAVVDVADKIVTNARLQLDAVKLVAEHGDRVTKHLPMIAASSNGNGNGVAKP
jgi:ribosomal protein L17